MKQLGVIVPIVTPCSKQGKVDVVGLKAVCADMIQAGCHGIFVAGSTGRGPWFQLAERIQICQAVAEELSSEKPILAGCMGAGLDEIIDNAKAMAESGAAMAVATAPMYFKYSPCELESIFLKFADASPIPVMIYDIPDFTGMNLAPDLLIKLASHQNVVGFKDSSSNYNNFKQLLNAIEKQVPDFYLMQGKEHLLKDSLIAGASGLVVSLLHVNPNLFVSLYNAVQQGNAELADRMQQIATRILECVNSCFARQPEFSTLCHFLNIGLKKRGIDVNICLEHEGQCPDWIEEKAIEAITITEDAFIG